MLVTFLRLMVFVLSFFSSLCLAEGRLALVIGNSNYAASPLKNPVNDARDMAKKLSELGFEVMSYTNVNRQNMRLAIRDFGNKLKRAEVGLFYFAGHGIQIKGINYLVPVATDISSADEVQDESIDANAILRKMESAGNKVNIVILDACRNNPFASSFRSLDRGLARMDGPVGSFIAYATSPGAVAADGQGRNGLYTQHLLSALNKPDLTIEQVFKKVRYGVVHDTGGKQTPWESSSLMGEFLFSATTQSARPKPAPTVPPLDTVTVGHVQIISNVPHAEIMINHVNRGVTDADGMLNVSNVLGSSAQVTVHAEGYVPDTQKVALVPNQWQQVSVALKSAEEKCYVGKKVILETQIETLGTDKKISAIQNNQVNALIANGFMRNKVAVLELASLAKKDDVYKVQTNITVRESPVTLIKTSLKTIDILLVLELSDPQTGKRLGSFSKAYRQVGSGTDEVLQKVLQQRAEHWVHALLVQMCAA